VTIKTYSYTYDLVENYYLKNLLEGDFWIFGGRSFREEPPRSLNTNAESIDVLSKTVFGRKLSQLDFSFMVRNILWTQGSVYQKYDDKTVLDNANFYVVIEPESESGPYEVFKCLSNDYNKPSQVKPVSNSSINEIGGVYTLSDGYTWKYMTSIPFEVFRKFTARGFVPIPRNSQVEALAVDGIDFIEVENPESNLGYQFIEGSINSKSQDGVYLLNIASSFFEATNAYRNSVVYVETEEEGAEVYSILTSRRVGQLLEVTIDGDIFTDFDSTSLITIQVLPKIDITGNGTGAKAIAIFNQQRNRISAVRILESGQGYSQATANVITPNYFSQLDEQVTSIATIRPIISPKGGHGSNIIRELRSNAICLSTSINSLGTEITDTGNYTTLALVKSPQFEETFSALSFDNRLEFVLQGTAPTATLQVGDIVTQTRNGQTVSGVIHEIVDGNTFFLIDFDGPSSIEFDSGFQINIRNNTFNISVINRPEYNAGTGDVLYITDFFPIERSADNTEQIKLLLEF
jgi:hypothetical protein